MMKRHFPDPCIQDNLSIIAEDREVVMAVMIMSLIQGETLQCRMIKTDTMHAYLCAFENMFRRRRLPFPTQIVPICFDKSSN